MAGVEHDDSVAGIFKEGVGPNGWLDCFFKVGSFQGPLPTNFSDGVVEPEEGAVDPASAAVGFEFEGVPFVFESDAIFSGLREFHSVVRGDAVEGCVDGSAVGDRSKFGMDMECTECQQDAERTPD